MKKFLLSLLALCVAAAGYAQLNGNGYYRVQNVTTSRYIKVLDSNFGSATSPNFDALRTDKRFDVVVSDPASVIYFKNVSGNTYDLLCEGVNTNATGYHLSIWGSVDNYQAGASAKGLTMYLFDSAAGSITGKVSTSGASKIWKILPVDAKSDNYFAITPDVTSKGAYYKSFYAPFPFSFASTGMEAYYVKKVDADAAMVVMEKIEGSVPGATPVFVKCSSTDYVNNKLNVLNTTVTAISGNQLKGQYLAGTSSSLAYDASTMRVLGTAPDGSLAFVKNAKLSTVPANTAYLVVPATAPDVLKVVTEEVYNSDNAITLTANDSERFYGDANPTFTYTCVNGDGTPTEPKGVPTFACSADAKSPVGTYDIEVQKGTVSNSTVNYVKGTLTVKPAVVEVTVVSVSRLKGDPNPEFEFYYSGLKNGETAESVLKTKPTAVCAATADSPVGDYEITCSGAEADNYVFVYSPSTLSVYNPVVTADDKTREYGSPNPTFTYSPAGVLNGRPEFKCDAVATSDVGEYPIVMSKGTVTNSSVQYYSGKLTVTKASLYAEFGTLTFTKKQGQPMPTFNFSYRGFKNGEDASVLTEPVVVECNATETSGPGEYTVQLKGGKAKNYDIRLGVSAKLIVTQADAVTITANSYKRVYGEENPVFDYSVTGASLNGKPQITCSADKNSPVGTYPIVISKGDVKNANDQYVNGVLEIVPAQLTVSAGTYTKKQGEDNPDFTLTYAGFKNNDTEAVLTTKPVTACSAQKSSAPGDYTVTVSGAEAKNYAISYVPGKLVVTEADAVAVVVKNVTRQYGEANPVFEYTVEGAKLDGTPELTCEATAASAVGTYDIVISKGTVTNYNVHFVNGTLTVTKAPLSVSVANYERFEGKTNPEFVIVYDGWKNGDTESVLTVKPTATTVATDLSPVGEYEIIVSGGEAQNYELSYANGKLTVIADPAASVSSIEAGNGDNAATFDVYTLSGVLLKKNATNLKSLAKGVYVVNGRKVVVK